MAIVPRQKLRVVGKRSLEQRRIHLPLDHWELLERAALLEGVPVQDFVHGAAITEARRILLERSILLLDNEERDAFLALLDSDPDPTAEALAGAQEYRAWRKSQAETLAI